MTTRPGDANSDEARSARGFNNDSAPLRDSLPEPKDPTGEDAYQRAFIESAKMNPPRVPNPLAYPNSPTAQAYIKTRTSPYGQPSTTRIPNAAYVPPPPDDHSIRRARREQERQRRLDDVDSAGSSPSVRHDSSGRASESQIRAPPQAFPPPPPHQQYYEQPSFASQHLQQQQPREHYDRGPNTLEPRLQAPSGPRNPFR